VRFCTRQFHCRLPLEDGQRENTALHPNHPSSGSVGRFGRVRRGSPDPAETPDRRSPFLLPGLTQETIGLQNQPATTRGPSVGSMGWSGDQSTTRIGIETNRKTSQEETCGRAFRRGRETRAERRTKFRRPAPNRRSPPRGVQSIRFCCHAACWVRCVAELGQVWNFSDLAETHA